MANRDLSADTLFGGKVGWRPEDWTSSDDRVRGGKSESHFRLENGCATFCGTLDVNTLGGAGFASQRTTGDDRHWDLSNYDGIVLLIDASKSDSKKYTFILKDSLQPRNALNGREQSTVSWEFDFSKDDAKSSNPLEPLMAIAVPWHSLRPTYRGRPIEDAKPLERGDVKRVSIMMRSFFGTQEGEFSLSLCSVSGLVLQKPDLTDGQDEASTISSWNKKAETSVQQPQSSIWSRLFCWRSRL